MQDLIIDKYNGLYIIYEIVGGRKVEVNRLDIRDFDDILEYIRENYDYARLLVGNCIY